MRAIGFKVAGLVMTCLLAGASKTAPSQAHQRHPKITLELLVATPDSKVEDLLYTTALARVDGAKDEYKAFAKLPVGLRMVFSTMVFEGEVNNGGFHQFFWNSSARYAKDALQGLIMIGAKHDAKLLAKAIDIYKKDQTKIEKFKKRPDGKGFLESEKVSRLNALDDPFFENGDHQSTLRINYIRAYPQKFVE